MSNVFTYCPIKGERNQTPLEGETTFTNRKISFLLKKKLRAVSFEAASPNSTDYLATPQNFQANGVQNFGSFAGKCLKLNNSATSLLVIFKKIQTIT